MNMPESPDAQLMMSLAADLEDAYQLTRRIEHRRELVAALPQPQRQPAALPTGQPQVVYTRPVDTGWELNHFERYGRWYLVGGGVVATGLTVWMVYEFVQWLNSLMSETANEVAAAASGGTGLLGIVALVGLLCLLGGGAAKCAGLHCGGCGS